jgi:hypothetical protein
MTVYPGGLLRGRLPRNACPVRQGSSRIADTDLTAVPGQPEMRARSMGADLRGKRSGAVS